MSCLGLFVWRNTLIKAVPRTEIGADADTVTNSRTDGSGPMLGVGQEQNIKEQIEDEPWMGFRACRAQPRKCFEWFRARSIELGKTVLLEVAKYYVSEMVAQRGSGYSPGKYELDSTSDTGSESSARSEASAGSESSASSDSVIEAE